MTTFFEPLIGYCIVAVPERTRLVKLIMEQLPRVYVSMDWAHNGLWQNSVKAWRKAARHPGATHIVALADDMLPVEDFDDLLMGAVSVRPHDVIGFFGMRKKVPVEAHERGSPWWTASAGNWGGATLIPIPFLEPWLTWCEEFVPAEYPHDDRRMTMYMLCRGQKQWMTTYSLVEHIAPSDSVLGNNNRSRTAAMLYAPWAYGPLDWTITDRAPHDGQVGETAKTMKELLRPGAKEAAGVWTQQ